MNIFSTFITQGTCEPQTEVVSVYDDTFKLYRDIPPNFIKVLRCVECAKCGNNHSHLVPVPNSTTTINFLVRTASGRTDTYPIYNHTSCKCGTKLDRDDVLYGDRIRKFFLM